MSAHKYSFNVAWSDDDEAFVATSPEFEGVSGFGLTPGAAIKEAQVALKLAMDVHIEKGWPLPEPAKLCEYSGQFRLRIPKKTHARLARQAAEEGVSLNTWALSLLEGNQSATEAYRAALKDLQGALASAIRTKSLGTASAATAASAGHSPAGYGPMMGGAKWPN